MPFGVPVVYRSMFGWAELILNAIASCRQAGYTNNPRAQEQDSGMLLLTCTQKMTISKRLHDQARKQQAGLRAVCESGAQNVARLHFASYSIRTMLHSVTDTSWSALNAQMSREGYKLLQAEKDRQQDVLAPGKRAPTEPRALKQPPKKSLSVTEVCPQFEQRRICLTV